jgi:hypothetical protein
MSKNIPWKRAACLFKVGVIWVYYNPEELATKIIPLKISKIIFCYHVESVD